MAGRGVLLLFAGAVLGAVATLVARPAVQPADAGAPANLSRDLEALRADVRALRELVERQRSLPAAPSGASPTSLAPAPDPVLAQLELLRAELKALADQVEAQSSESAAALADLRAGLGGLGTSTEPMPESLPDTPPDLQAFDRISERPENEVTDEHLFWTYDQVAGTYGRPTRVQPNPATSGGGIKFIYELPGGGTCIFWFKGGKVVRVYP